MTTPATSLQDVPALAAGRSRVCTVCKTSYPVTGAEALQALFEPGACSSDECKRRPQPVPLVIRSAGNPLNLPPEQATPRDYVAVKHLGGTGGSFDSVFACIPRPAAAAQEPAVYVARRFVRTAASGDENIDAERCIGLLERLRGCCVHRMPRVWDVVEDWFGSRIYITDFIPGQPLSAVIEKHQFSEPEVVDFLKQMAVLLHQLHFHAGALHRDITPGRVLVLPPAGQSLSARTLAYALVPGLHAAPALFCPEETRERGVGVDASDIFSLGLTAVCMLIHASDAMPPRPDIREALQPQPPDLHGPPCARLCTLSEDLRDVLRKMLQEDCARRHQTAFELYADLMRRFPEDDPLDEALWQRAEPTSIVRCVMKGIKLTFDDLLRTGSTLPPKFTPGTIAKHPTADRSRTQSGVDRVLPVHEGAHVKSFELQVALPDHPSTCDAPSLVHVVRLSILSVNVAQALRTPVRARSVPVGSKSTAVPIEMELAPGAPRSVVFGRIRSDLQQLGVRRLALLRLHKGGDRVPLLDESFPVTAESRERVRRTLAWGLQSWRLSDVAATSQESSNVTPPSVDKGRGAPRQAAPEAQALAAGIEPAAGEPLADRDGPRRAEEEVAGQAPPRAASEAALCEAQAALAEARAACSAAGEREAAVRAALERERADFASEREELLERLATMGEALEDEEARHAPCGCDDHAQELFREVERLAAEREALGALLEEAQGEARRAAEGEAAAVRALRKKDAALARAETRVRALERELAAVPRRPEPSSAPRDRERRAAAAGAREADVLRAQLAALQVDRERWIAAAAAESDQRRALGAVLMSREAEVAGLRFRLGREKGGASSQPAAAAGSKTSVEEPPRSADLDLDLIDVDYSALPRNSA